MIVYVSIDMEGVAGIATPNQVKRGSDDYPASRRLMTLEANAAVEGAFDGGAERVVVNDSHGDMANLLPDELDVRAELVIGSPKVGGSMVEGLDGGFDIALFVGYHAGAGVEGGVLAHTYSGAGFYDVRLDGRSATETELNAHLAAAHDVPVGLVTGDDKICALAEERLPGVRTVAVKRGHSSAVAASLHPQVACERIREAAAAAVRAADGLEPLRDPPGTIEVDLTTLAKAEVCALVPGVKRLGGRTVRFASDAYPELFRCLRAWLYLAAAA
jgi:D-amino peptidase